LVDGDGDVADAQQPHQVTVAPGLRQDPLARVHHEDRGVGRGGAGDHVAGVLFVPRGVRDDELSPVRREEAVGHVDGDALLPLRGQPVDEQREIELLALRAPLARIRLHRGKVVLEQHLGVVQQPPDQRALAVVHAAAGDEAQQALVLVRLEVAGDVRGDEVADVRHQK